MKIFKQTSSLLNRTILLSLCCASFAFAQPKPLLGNSAAKTNAAQTINSQVDTATVTNVRELQRLFNAPPDDSRIMMRWWWFGPAVTQSEIEREMQAMKAAGIGGFELAVVYPMTPDDRTRGIRNDRYLSPEFLENVKFTAKKAREMNLRMDITIGSGWSFGGPYITPDLAAARLRTERREIAPTVRSIARPVPAENERLIAAFVGRGSIQETDPTNFQRLDISGEKAIELPPADGPRVLAFYFSSRTGQNVKRAALGAEGYVLDHYSRPAIEKHLQEAGDKLLGAADPRNVYSIFCDSLEVYQADWTENLLAEFQKRRGYDLTPLLPFLEYDAGARSDQVRRDYGRTLSELYEQNFLVPMREWATRNGVRFRIQNYGEPPATLASARHADLIDGEGFNWRTQSSARWAASASHLFGKPVATSETWTWIHSPSFRATPLDLKAEADLHFLSGINQLIGHGFPYSPPAARKPGWLFYAAGALNDQNPWWTIMPDLSAYLQRASFLLRQGEPIANVALYVPTEDAYATMKLGSERYLNVWAKANQQIGANIIPAILDSGHNFDLFDDGTLKETENRNYKTIVLPNVRYMPEATISWLAEFARRGGTVLAVGRKPEGDLPFAEVTGESELLARLNRAGSSDITTAPATAEIGFVHRRLPDADVYFLAHTGNTARRVNVRFAAATPNAELWNLFTGTAERIEARDNQFALNFEPYATHAVVFRKTPGSAPLAQNRAVVAEEDLPTGWSVSFESANKNGATISLPHSWTDDAARRYFSGTAIYRRTIELSAARRPEGVRVFLDFGAARPIEREPLPGGTIRGNSFAALVAPPIREAATVFVNNRRAGSLWAPPYKIDITDLLKSDVNEIRIEVANTAINQMAQTDQLADFKTVTERYGQRARLQDLQILQPIPSGILAVPRLTFEK